MPARSSQVDEITPPWSTAAIGPSHQSHGLAHQRKSLDEAAVSCSHHNHSTGARGSLFCTPQRGCWRRSFGGSGGRCVAGLGAGRVPGPPSRQFRAGSAARRTTGTSVHAAAARPTPIEITYSRLVDAHLAHEPRRAGTIRKTRGRVRRGRPYTRRSRLSGACSASRRCCR